MDLEFLTKGWTPGGVGIWLILGSLLLGMWKGLPAVLDAWSSSVAKEREHREREIMRLEGQIQKSDERHAECMEGQRKLRDEITEIQKNHAAEIARLQNLISGMVIQMRQMQVSSVGGRVVPPMPTEISAMLQAIEERDGRQ